MMDNIIVPVKEALQGEVRALFPAAKLISTLHFLQRQEAKAGAGGSLDSAQNAQG